MPAGRAKTTSRSGPGPQVRATVDGDLLVMLDIKDDERFEARGKNCYDISLSFSQAALGGKCAIRLQYGTNLEVRAGRRPIDAESSRERHQRLGQGGTGGLVRVNV